MENNVHTDELCHAGRKGMRWGQHIFCGPDCDKHGSKGKKGKKQEEETTEQKKERILKSRSARALYDNADLFTTQELNSAYNRLMLENNIKNLAPAEVSKGQRFVNKFNSSGKNIHDVFETSSKLYNDAAKIYNTFLKGDGDPLPLIKDNDKKNPDNKAKNNKPNDSKSDKGKDADKSDKTDKSTGSETKADKKQSSDSSEKVHTGTVHGEGTSRRKEKEAPIIDVDFEDVSVSDVPKSITDLGRDYIAGLLEAPKKRDDD